MARDSARTRKSFAHRAALRRAPLPDAPRLDVEALLVCFAHREGLARQRAFVHHALEQFAPFLLIFVFWYGGRLVSGPIQSVSSLLFSITQALAT